MEKPLEILVVDDQFPIENWGKNEYPNITVATNHSKGEKLLLSESYDWVVTDLGLNSPEQVYLHKKPYIKSPDELCKELYARVEGTEYEKFVCDKFGHPSYPETSFGEVALGLTKKGILSTKEKIGSLTIGSSYEGVNIAYIANEKSIPYTIFTADLGHGRDGVSAALLLGLIDIDDVVEVLKEAKKFEKKWSEDGIDVSELREAMKNGKSPQDIPFLSSSKRLAIGESYSNVNYKFALDTWKNLVKRLYGEK